MPYTKEQLEEWVKGFKVADDKKTQLLQLLADPEILPEIGNGVMRQSDYSKKLDEMRVEREAVEEQKQLVLSRRQELEGWYDTNSPLYTKALEDLDKAKVELARMTDAYIKQNGSLPTLTDTPPPAKPDDKPPFDASSFVSKDDLSKVVPALTQWPVQFQKIAQEHFQLTGEYPDGEKILAEVYKGKSARQAWEDTHGIPAIRERKQKEHFEAELKAAREDERAKVMTEMAVDPAARRDNATGSFSSALALANEDPSAAVVADQNSRARAAKSLEGFDPRL